MGMFDYIKCEFPLPREQGRRYQTKDFDCRMERYTITVDGRLVHHTVRYEETPRHERPYPDEPEDSPLSICGIIKSVPTGDVEIPYHGDIHFYDYDQSLIPPWIGWIARFTNGRVEWVKDDAAPRKETR